MDRILTFLTHPAVLVGLGGALGANLRYWTSVAFTRWLGPSFPWGTLAVNVVGSLLLGLLMGFFSGPVTRPIIAWRLFLGVGLCGGFTTFSTFSVEVFRLMKSGQSGLAFCYVLGSVILGLSAAWLGYRLGDSSS